MIKLPLTIPTGTLVTITLPDGFSYQAEAIDGRTFRNMGEIFYCKNVSNPTAGGTNYRLSDLQDIKILALPRLDVNAELRETSGGVQYHDKLTDFLYHLLRDHLPAADVEKLFRNSMETNHTPSAYTNGWLAQYANHMSQRLKEAL